MLAGGGVCNGRRPPGTLGLPSSFENLINEDISANTSIVCHSALSAFGMQDGQEVPHPYTATARVTASRWLGISIQDDRVSTQFNAANYHTIHAM